MKPRITIHTLLFHADYWLEFDTLEEQRATMALLDRTTMGNLSRKGATPFYLIERREQQDALDRFLRELGRARPTPAGNRGE